MRAIVRYPLLLAVCCVLAACASESMPGAGQSSLGAIGGEPETEDQKILNALGQALGQNVVPAGLTADELAFVQRGLSDAVLERDSLVDLDEYDPQIQVFMQSRATVAAEGELTLATASMDKQASVEGAERTESGIVIQEIAAGSGSRPAAEDTVQVH